MSWNRQPFSIITGTSPKIPAGCGKISRGSASPNIPSKREQPHRSEWRDGGHWGRRIQSAAMPCTFVRRRKYTLSGGCQTPFLSSVGSDGARMWGTPSKISFCSWSSPIHSQNAILWQLS
ncbi:hypothetical protein NDU88_005910 [Pleurodeles waltl]|uniref:Uncharacterized protein n=1 Tax=Pleurodeles waltl TaxID=8319 RepID=A0AAV7UME9_PLEWA|nr:hypothetical protein NDU88_005910 [Pleurodeles waltl]